MVHACSSSDGELKNFRDYFREGATSPGSASGDESMENDEPVNDDSDLEPSVPPRAKASPAAAEAAVGGAAAASVAKGAAGKQPQQLPGGGSMKVGSGSKGPAAAAAAAAHTTTQSSAAAAAGTGQAPNSQVRLKAIFPVLLPPLLHISTKSPGS